MENISSNKEINISKSNSVEIDSNGLNFFQISDVGDFEDGLYHEQESSRLMGKIVGRAPVSFHNKSTFNVTDIAFQGYLNKEGRNSWFKTWKTRYFILRKDIKELCYFSDKESLILLGSIKIDKNTKILEIKGYGPLTFGIESNSSASVSLYILQAESQIELKQWKKFILKEALSSEIIKEESWWTRIFESNINAESIKKHTNKERRTGLITINHAAFEQPTGVVSSINKMIHKDTSTEPLVTNTNSQKQKQLSYKLPDTDKSNDNEEIDEETLAIFEPLTAFFEEGNGINAEFYDIDSDDDDYEFNNAMIGNSKLKKNYNDNEQPVTIRIYTEEEITTIRKINSSKSDKKIKKEKLPKISKPPMEKNYNTLFDNNNDLSGWKINLKLTNICEKKDRYQAYVFVKPYQGLNEYKPISYTEIFSITDSLINEAEDGNVLISFNVLQANIPKESTQVQINLYKVKKSGDGTDITNVSTGPAVISSCTLHAKNLIGKSICNIKSMTLRDKSIINNERSNSKNDMNPPNISLGLIRVHSKKLFDHRNLFTEMLGMKPYSESFFAFNSTLGIVETHEHLYVSKYATKVSYIMSSLYYLERKPLVYYVYQKLKEQEAKATKELGESDVEILGDIDILSINDEIKKKKQKMDNFIQSFEDVYDLCCGGNRIGTSNTVGNVIDQDVGGLQLRRSAWKKQLPWQSCTMNLNVHLCSSIINSFYDVINMTERESDINVLPTITLGCPAAHSCHFSHGGLRRIFGSVDRSRRLKWMFELQSCQDNEKLRFPNLQYLHDNFPVEWKSIFGKLCNMNANHDNHSSILLKKLEIANRIDICSTQAIGFAITAIRTIILLANTIGGSHYKSLVRSLRLGFLLSFESFLSTAGDELGMIEDLDYAALWLSLISMRFVTSSTPVTEDVIIRRDKSNRIIVDLILSEIEASTVVSALNELSTPIVDNEEKSSDSDPLRFNRNPQFNENCNNLTVITVVSVTGVAFSQGVNEMQYLANKTGSRECSIQADINEDSLDRLEDYYKRYKELLMNESPITSPRSPEVVTKSKLKRRSSIVSVMFNKKEKEEELPEQTIPEILSLEILFKEVQDAIRENRRHIHQNHIHVLLKTSSLCRLLGGTIGLLCKSGKDRTSMGVTLENTRNIVETLGVTNGENVVGVFRQHGVRRMNVWANTGQPFFAFNRFQVSLLPSCYKPPDGTFSSAVSS